jgi:hypothetical protein
MAIRTMNPKDRGQSDEFYRWQRKANQEWDLAGLARQDGDTQSENFHTAKAREYAARAAALRQ